MTRRVELIQPRDERGNDANDWRDDPQYLSRLKHADDSEEHPVCPWDNPAILQGMLSKPPPPMEWLVRDRLQLGRGALVTGIGGSSKTRLLYHLAIGASIGHLPWGWEVAVVGSSVLVLTEDTDADVHRTLHAISHGLRLNETQRQAVERSLTVFALAGQDLKLLAKNERGALTKTPNFELLSEKIRALDDIVFVGIDPALSVTEGDEASQNDQRQLGKMADDLAVLTGATVMLAAHAPKGNQQTDELASHNSRGGGAITDAVRGEYAMRTMTATEASRAGIGDIEERKRHVQLVATKGNHLPPAAYVPIWLRRGDFGVLALADLAYDTPDTLTSQDLDALSIFEKLAATGAVKLDDWRQECLRQGVISQAKPVNEKKAMDRIKVRLLTAGRIERGFTRGFYHLATAT